MLVAANIAVVTPTKGRHKQLRELLRTLSAQTAPVGQVIIADGGHDAEPVVAAYNGRLPVLWLACPTPGQIAQRNFALTHLDPRIEVVVYLDDDIQLEPDAIEKLVACWNSRDEAPSGMTINITNMPKQPDSLFRRIFCMQTEPKGRVLKSGYNTPMIGLTENIRSEWLIGGATAWRRDVLVAHINRPIPSRWAITEDLRFSYSLHKTGAALYGCAEAKVRHIDDTITEDFATGVFRGNNATLWRYLLVAENAELSKFQFFWMMFGQTLVRFALGLTGRSWHLGYTVGQLKGIAIAFYALVTRTDIARFLK
jgi:glycosyltransferase involved in cell wall biosynthesis